MLDTGLIWCFDVTGDAYCSDGKYITGRQSAGQGFLEAFTEHASPSKVFLVNDSPSIFNQFAGRFSDRHSVLSIKPNDIETLLSADIFFQSSPLICTHAWQRRYASESAFSLVGLTHSVATERAILGIQEYITAPLHNWDALICTSRAAKSAVNRILLERKEYLQERRFRVPDFKFQLPIIPLGVNTPAYAMDDRKRKLRKKMRETVGIAENDIAGLYVGRMDSLSKAHPTPLFLSMELAQKKSTTTKFHLLMAGQFQNQQTEDDFKKAARIFAPSVDVHWIDGHNPEQVESAWASGDIFLSLSDNIQESYGLTLIEAMSAGLPVIASDWDGYRDTIIHNRTGFLIKTTFPPEHTGKGLAEGLALQRIGYSSYLGVLGQFTAVDIGQCRDAIIALAENANLRNKMSRNAIKRARENYNWPQIIGEYEQLAKELTLRRKHQAMQSAQGKFLPSCNPAYPNPLRIFSEHPTNILNENMVVSVTSENFVQHISLLTGFQIHSFSHPLMLDVQNMIAMLKAIEKSSAKVRDILLVYPDEQKIKVFNSLMWLYKFGIIEVKEASDRSA